MDIIKRVNWILLILLGISSGIAKLMLPPNEVEFFGAAGFSDALILVFGACHIAGGLLLIYRPLKKLGPLF